MRRSIGSGNTWNEPGNTWLVFRIIVVFFVGVAVFNLMHQSDLSSLQIGGSILWLCIAMMSEKDQAFGKVAAWRSRIDAGPEGQWSSADAVTCA